MTECFSYYELINQVMKAKKNENVALTAIHSDIQPANDVGFIYRPLALWVNNEPGAKDKKK